MNQKSVSEQELYFIFLLEASFQVKDEVDPSLSLCDPVEWSRGLV